MSKPRNAIIANIQKHDARRFHTRVKQARAAGQEYERHPLTCPRCWELEEDCKCEENE